MERSSGKVQLALVWNEECYRDATPKLQLLAKDLRSSYPDLFHSIWANFRYTPPSEAPFARSSVGYFVQRNLHLLYFQRLCVGFFRPADVGERDVMS